MAPDVVLGVITSSVSDACWHELNAAKRLRKNTIVMAEPVVAPELEPHFPGSVLVINPTDPAQAEVGIVQFLKKTELDQGAMTALIALGTLALVCWFQSAR